MDFMQRLALTYLGFLVAAPSIAWWMQANGAAYLGNPAWRLVSALRSLALGSLVVLVLLGLIYVACELVAAHRQETKRREEEANEKALREAAQVRCTERQKESSRVCFLRFANSFVRNLEFWSYLQISSV